MIKYDFHLHTVLSPCADEEMTPNNIVNMAHIAGVNAIAITDHNTIGNVRSAQIVGERLGVTVIPGMEIETAEEVHVLTLYRDIESAREIADIVYKNLPMIKNNPRIFGSQILMDENDNIIGEEEKLLISPTTIPIEKLFKMVKSVGGIAMPAHVDRHSYSILTNLGFIPEELNAKWIEMSYLVDDTSEYILNRTDLAKYKILQNSDAHYLKNIASRENILECELEELFRW
ncbi:MAG: PHP domain-containing protein [Bacillota bacterium]|nr:PHP domain-containing protein [Bacillota bacterium]